MSTVIRPETATDHAVIRAVNRLAFGGEGEARLVDALRDGGHTQVSLVAEEDGQVVGHVLFSDLPIVTSSGTVHALALAPLAMIPSHQRRGIGSMLVGEGLRSCRDAGHRIVVVLGHPEFYPRFGFSEGGRGAQVGVLGTGVHGDRVGAGGARWRPGRGPLPAAVRRAVESRQARWVESDGGAR